MSKLDEIEAYFVHQMPATWPEGYREACTWLIQRVRKLEQPLRTRVYEHDHAAAAPCAGCHKCRWMREALKES